MAYPSQGMYQQQDPTQVQNEQALGLLPMASHLANQGGPAPYPGYQHSYFNPLQQQGQNTFLQGQTQSIADAYSLRPMLKDMYGAAIGSMTDTLQGGGTPPPSPYGTGAINAAVGRVTDEVLRNQMPGIDLGAVGAGQSGSSRQAILQGNALSNAQDASGRAAAEQNARDYQSWLGAWGRGQDQVANAWRMTPELFGGFESSYLKPASLTSQLGTAQMGVGGEYQNLSNQFMADEKSYWDAIQNQPYGNADWYGSLLGTAPSLTNQTTTGSTERNYLKDILGGASTGYGLWKEFQTP